VQDLIASSAGVFALADQIAALGAAVTRMEKREGRADPRPAPRNGFSAIVAEIKLLERHRGARPLTEVVVERVVPDH
jgi:hypothetical protein